MRKEAVVHGYEATNTLHAHLRRAENGFVVEVAYPKHMLGDPIVDTMQSVFNKITRVGEPGSSSGDPMALLNQAIGEIKNPPRPLRKPHEEYVFSNIDSALNFLKEIMLSAEK